MSTRLSLLCGIFFIGLLGGCAAPLEDLHKEGYAILVYPDNGGTVRWRLDGGAHGLAETGRNIGGGYRAAALKPGRYSAEYIYNVAERSSLGRGNKDLDYGERVVGRGGSISEAKRLPPAKVKRLPIKEEVDVGRSGVRLRPIPSEYRISLELPPLAFFEVSSGAVVLLPSLNAVIRLDEKSCLRYGDSASPYNVYYENPDLHYILSDNPEDLHILEWQCPVRQIDMRLISSDAAHVRAEARKLSAPLMQKLTAGELSLTPRLQHNEISPQEFYLTGP